MSDAAHFLTELVGSYDAEKLRVASLHLAEIIRRADSRCLQLLIERDVVRIILRVMDSLPSHCAAQQAACDVILSCNEHIDLRARLEEHQAFRQVMKAMAKHEGNCQLMGKALHTLASLALSAVNETIYKENKVYMDVVRVLKRHSNNASLQNVGLLALTTLLEMDPFAASSMALAEDCDFLLATIKQHSRNIGVVTNGFQTLRCIAKFSASSRKLQELHGNLEYICEVLARNLRNEDIVSAALGLLEALSMAELGRVDEQPAQTLSAVKSMANQKSDLLVRSYLKQPWLLQLISQLLGRFKELAEVQMYGFKILYSVCTVTRLEVSDELLYYWLSLLADGMHYHGEHVDVSEGACCLLSALLVLYPDLHTSIGDAEHQFPLHNHVWVILLGLSCNPNSSLFTAASTAFYYMVECDDNLQQLLLHKGASLALTECVRGYLNTDDFSEDSVECGCRALKGILMHHCSDEQKEYLMKVGIFADLQVILDQFMSSASVIAEAFCIIACLSDLINFQEEVVAHSLYKGILENVEKHIRDEIIVEIALEIFIILSLNEQMISYLNDNEVLGLTVSMMKKHVTSSSIQFKGCMLIRLLYEYSLFSDSLCIGIAKAVVDALSRKKDRNVQCEALACAQVLCRCSQQMAMHLVKGDIHIMLFTLLYKDTGNGETELEGATAQTPQKTESEEKAENFFFEVGTDIIYTLSCVYDFKQEMLATTVKDGLLAGVRILIEIGADINVGKPDELLICLAVQSRNKKMVEFLLDHGVSSANIKAALAISREYNLDYITGLLLEHISVDRSRDVVNLSGLELTSLKPLWILPSLGVKLNVEPKEKRRLTREGSLGHVKDHILRRKRSSSELMVVESDNLTPLRQTSSVYSAGCSWRSSIDITALGYLHDREKRLGIDEPDGTSYSPVSYKFSSGPENPLKQSEWLAVQNMKLDSPGGDSFDSGIQTRTTQLSLVRNTILLSPMLCEVNTSVVSRTSFRKQAQGAISGAKSLPHGQLAKYALEYMDGISTHDLSCSHNLGDFSLSPAQLCRQLRRVHRNRSRLPVMESRNSLSCSQTDFPFPVSTQQRREAEDKDSPSLSGNGSLSISNPSSTDSSTQIDGSEPGTGIDSSFETATSESFAPVSHNASSSNPGANSAVLASRNKRMKLRLEMISKPIFEQDELTSFHKPSNLIKVLDLSSNQLKNFDDFSDLKYGGKYLFELLRDVRRLDVKQNLLSELPVDMMKEMVELSVIMLSCNNFQVFPMGAVCSERLTVLDLSSNKLTVIPLLSTMKNLVKLNLSDNQLRAMPQCVCVTSGEPLFPHLRQFDLRSNQIMVIPNFYTRLNDLEVFLLAKNQIHALPDEFLANMPSLRILDASMNNISHIGGMVGQDMVYLEELRLAHNRLSECEAAFNSFSTAAPVLQVVDASDNGLSSIPPPYAWKSRAIRELRYNKNKVIKLDLSDGKRFWSRLESFHIGQNRIKELPSNIGQLRSLCLLDISHNKDIKRLPNEMGDLDHLFILNLQGLKGLSLDPTLLNGPTKTIISYLKSRHAQSVPCYRIKMMMVGAADKGKTTLLHSLLQLSSSSSSKTNVSTMGVSVRQWSYQHRKPGGNMVSYNVNCWDFAGQEEFYSTHQCFLSQRSLYVLVYNLYCGVSELQHLQPWLLNIQARAPSSLVIIVGTHLDQFKLPQEEVNKKRILMRAKVKEMLRQPGFPVDVSFAEVDCFNDKCVNDLRMKIKGLIDSAKLRGQKIMGGLVPSYYIALEQLVLKERKLMEKTKSKFPVLRESRLYQLMEETKLNLMMDRSEVQQAIKFLHECGVLLHYNDLQTKLSELYFLNPAWLCTLMAQVITLKHISFIDDKGFMDRKTIPHLLKEPKFPSEFIPEYIRLLERFEVVLKHTGNKLLIPSRLPKTPPPPNSFPPVSPGAQLNRRYVFCYIPPGFWPRLITRILAFPQLLPVSLTAQKSNEPQTLQVWSGGIFMYWSETCYCLVHLLPDKSDVFDIAVPTGSVGTQLLCAIVDNVEALVDEWFPGLREISIIDGSHLILQFALCPLCPDTASPHCFPMVTLLKLAFSADKVKCPIHKDYVELDHLAPDIIVGDLTPDYKVPTDELLIDEKAQNILGKGGFADVYKAMYHQKTVAVKIFSQGVASISNTTPNQLIRQEVQILSKLHHPHVIGLIGVCLKRKAMLVLEYAELGSLSSMRPYRTLSTQLKHRIALQIASALAFLHKKDIIYRDLKPGNILMFSLSTLEKVNAKLSDYGIACYATSSGLTQSVGTPGYRAPELLLSTAAYMSYYDKVDVYSFGLMLFELMTDGHKPFDELSAGCEIDKFIAEGRPINDVDYYGCPPWPDMQDLINHCLQYVPTQRPSAQDMFERLCNSEFLALKRAFPVEREHSVETFAIRLFSDSNGCNNMEIWVVSTLYARSMLSVVNFSQRNENQGTIMAPNTVIFSIAAIDSDLVLMGSNGGDILVYDGRERKLKHRLCNVRDSVISLIYFKGTKDSVVCAGLANGELFFYNRSVLMAPDAKGHKVKIGNGPVKSIKRYHGKLYLTCGCEIVIVKVSTLEVERRWEAIQEKGPFSFLTNIEVDHNSIWTSQSKHPRLDVWDREDGTLTKVLHCDSIINTIFSHNKEVSSHDARVMSLQLQQYPSSILWVGLASGHLLLVNALSKRPVMVTKRHMRSIRCIRLVKATIADKPVHYVMSGGYGFQQRPGSSAPEKGSPETYGSLLVWDTIMPKLKSNFDEMATELNSFTT